MQRPTAASGSMVLTGTSSMIIPLRGMPDEIEVWFDEACDVDQPNTCSPMCPYDEIDGEPQPLPHHRWGLKITWTVLGERTRKAYWAASIDGIPRPKQKPKGQSHDDED